MAELFTLEQDTKEAGALEIGEGFVAETDE